MCATRPGTLRFSSFAIDDERQCLVGPAGELRLRPKSLEVLRYLAQNAGRAVEKDELLEAVWAGVFVTEDSLTQCVSEIRRALGPEHRNVIKTIAKRGYLFNDLVLSKAVDRNLSRNQKTSVAILPFANLSAGHLPAYFVDGLTEGLITAISKWRWLRVIACNTSLSYKGTINDLQLVAAELRVGYVVTGSIRTQRGKLRISTQVIETSSLEQVWADHFDGHSSEVFEFQDRITRRVAATIDPALRSTEIQRSLLKPTENLDAWDCYLQGNYEFHCYKKAAMARASKFFERALRIDPHMAPAHARLAGVLGLEAILGWSKDYDLSLDAAHAAANAAISIDELDALGYAALARASLWKGLHDGALEAANSSIALNPSCHEAYSLRGQCLTFVRRPLEAIESFDSAMELSPRDPLAWATHGLKSFALFLSGQFREAIHETDKALALRPRYAMARLVRAASLSKLRKMKEARVQRNLVSPDAILNFKGRWPFRYETDRTKILRALAKI